MANGRVVAMMEAQSLQVALKYYVPRGTPINMNSLGGGLIRWDKAFFRPRAPPVPDWEEVLTCCYLATNQFPLSSVVYLPH